MFIEDRTQGIRISWRGCYSFPTHLHHNIELLVCTEDGICAVCGGESRTLRRGDMMIAFPNDVHAYETSLQGEGVMMIFDPRIVSLFENRFSQRRYENFLLTGDETLVSYALSALHEFDSADCSFEILCGYLYILLGSALKALPYADVPPGVESDLLREALQYISEHYTEPLTLKSLARKFGVDPCHLSRTFSQKIPGGFLHYLQQLRTEYARQLLRTSDLDIYNVACESGFSNIRTFNRVFKSITGMTPTDCRREAQKMP